MARGMQSNRASLTAATLLLASVLTAGCGGGGIKGKNSSPSGDFGLDVQWQSLNGTTRVKSRAEKNDTAAPNIVAPRLAQSIEVRITGDKVQVVRANRDNSRTDSYDYNLREPVQLDAIGGPLAFRDGAKVDLDIIFWSGPNGSGEKVREVLLEQKVLAGDGGVFSVKESKQGTNVDFQKELDTNAKIKIKSVKIAEGQIFPTGILKILSVTAQNTEDKIITVDPSGLDSITIDGDYEIIKNRIRIRNGNKEQREVSVTVDKIDSGKTKITANPSVTVTRIGSETETPRTTDALANRTLPDNTPLTIGASRQLYATVENNGSESSAIAWQIVSGTGNISETTGLFTATQAGTVVLEARSALDQAVASPPLRDDNNVTVTARIALTIVSSIVLKKPADQPYLAKDGLDAFLSSFPGNPNQYFNYSFGDNQPPAANNGSLTLPASTVAADAPRIEVSGGRDIRKSAITLRFQTSDGSPLQASLAEQNAGTVAVDPDRTTLGNTPPENVYAFKYTAPNRAGTFTLRLTSVREPDRVFNIKITVQAQSLPVTIL